MIINGIIYKDNATSWTSSAYDHLPDAPAGYEPPADRVPSTGAWLPANGRPTLVFVDAIW